MKLNVEEIKKMLGYPINNVELSEEQFKLCIKFTEEQIKNFKSKKYTKDYIFNKLVIINSKRLYRHIYTKYNNINTNLNWMRDIELEEFNFLQIIEK